EPEKQQRAECPFGRAQKPACAANSEERDQPEDERTIGDKRLNDLRFVFEPFLVAEHDENEDHRRAHKMEVEVLLQEPGSGQELYQVIHSRASVYERWGGARPPD